jgi:peptidoglycan/LPS O-acetylase OafA/YrhL
VKKYQIVDLVRTFAILRVISSHLDGLMGEPDKASPLHLWYRLTTNGYNGVILFFVVSGFLITGVLANSPRGLFEPDVRKFYVQRMGRLLPLLIFSIALGTILRLCLPNSAPGSDFEFAGSADFDVWFWFAVFLFSFNFLVILRAGTNQWYGLHWTVLWSLSVEEQFYLFFPVSLRWLKNRKNLFIFLAIIIICSFLWRTGVVFFQHPIVPAYVGYFPLGVFDAIAMGVLLYLIKDRCGDLLANNKMMSFFIFSLGFILFVFDDYFSIPEPWGRIFEHFFIATGAFCLLLGGLNNKLFESKYLTWLSWPGKYCYGIYLFHATIIFFINRSFLYKTNIFIGFLVLTVIATCVSAVSYHFFEMPANRFIRTFFEKRTLIK